VTGAARSSPGTPQARGVARAIRVLVADDNRDLALSLAMLLEAQGCDVKCAHDGRDAMVEIAEFEPEVVIADLGMPGLTGWDIARVMRKIGGEHPPLLVAMSGKYTNDADRTAGAVAGFHHHLAKPFDTDEILALIARVAAG
jgi:two-component system, OmpR family, response regulator